MWHLYPKAKTLLCHFEGKYFVSEQSNCKLWSAQYLQKKYRQWRNVFRKHDIVGFLPFGFIVTKSIFFWNLYLIFLARKIALKTNENYMRFFEPKFSDRNLENYVLWHLYPKTKKNNTPFSRKYFVSDELPYSTPCSAVFYEKIYRQWRNIFPEKWRTVFVFGY